VNGQALRGDMDAALWASASELCNFEGSVDISPSASPMRASPLDYGAYSDLALNIPRGKSLSDESQAEAAAHLHGRLATQSGTPLPGSTDHLKIFNFSSEDYSPFQVQRLARWFDTEENKSLGLAPVDQAGLTRVRDYIGRALQVMEKADPELFGEIIAIVDEIMLASADPSHSLDFTAGSSFALWGGIVVNCEKIDDWTEIYNTLVHEQGHSLLFAIARDEPLVLNPNVASFTSPVRDDLRPMDGIYHTAFVTAREARALDRLLAWQKQSGELSAEDLRLIEDSLEISVITFWQSLEAMGTIASLSDLGQSIMDECRDYMTRNFALVYE